VKYIFPAVDTQTFDALHDCPEPQLPQLAERPVPQLSTSVTVPQLVPSREQNAALLSGVQVHTLDALHDWPEPQLPQLVLRAALQLSVPLTVPQFLPSREQNAALLSGEQLHTLVASQLCGEVQLPHPAVRAAPQLSVPLTLPQFLPSRAQKAASVSAVQPQTLDAPQTWGDAQLPHDAVRGELQLSVPITVPQFLPSREQNAPSVSGEHEVHWPAALHWLEAAQLPQLALRLTPQLSTAVKLPHARPAWAHSVASDSGEQLMHVPASVQVWLPAHAVHAAPPVPQALSLCDAYGTQESPSQQPLAQVVASQWGTMHAPFAQPLGHAVSAYEYAQRPVVPSQTPIICQTRSVLPTQAGAGGTVQLTPAHGLSRQWLSEQVHETSTCE
jgi:hypothetical protein